MISGVVEFKGQGLEPATPGLGNRCQPSLPGPRRPLWGEKAGEWYWVEAVLWSSRPGEVINLVINESGGADAGLEGRFLGDPTARLAVT